MLNKTFIRFFLYFFLTSSCIGIIVLVIGLINNLKIYPIGLFSFIIAIVGWSLTMGILGYFYACPETYYLSKEQYKLSDIELKTKSFKYDIVNKNENEIIISSSNKLMDWFYDKIYIKNTDDKIVITAARNILFKYFRPIQNNVIIR